MAQSRSGTALGREVPVDRSVQRAVLATMRELPADGSHGVHRLREASAQKLLSLAFELFLGDHALIGGPERLDRALLTFPCVTYR